MKTRDEQLYAAVRDIRLCFNLLRARADEMHADLGVNASMRAVMESLAGDGERTVPDIARSRGVSRQHIQKLVNGLAEDGLVELVPNPAHKKSRLVAITDVGRKVAAATARRERKILPEIARDIPLEDIRVATSVLASLKEAFESDRWRELVQRE